MKITARWVSEKVRVEREATNYKAYVTCQYRTGNEIVQCMFYFGNSEKFIACNFWNSL